VVDHDHAAARGGIHGPGGVGLDEIVVGPPDAGRLGQDGVVAHPRPLSWFPSALVRRQL